MSMTYTQSDIYKKQPLPPIGAVTNQNPNPYQVDQSDNYSYPGAEGTTTGPVTRVAGSRAVAGNRPPARNLMHLRLQDVGGEEKDTFDHERYIKREGKFTFDLCTCCKRGQGFCCEAWCCYYCNLTRQCFMCCNNKFVGIDYCCALSCCGMALADSVTSFCLCYFCTCGGPISWCVNCCTRSKTRMRFGIEGTCCCDGCAAMFCACCVVQQTLGEYFVHGYYHPTSCCYYSYPTPQLTATNMQ